jgi:hypothetical protein
LYKIAKNLDEIFYKNKKFEIKKRMGDRKREEIGKKGKI